MIPRHARIVHMSMRVYSLPESFRQRKHAESGVEGYTGIQLLALMVAKCCRGLGAGGMTICTRDSACNSWTVRHACRMQIQVFDMLVFKRFCTLHTSVIRAQSTQAAAYACTVAALHACSIHLSSVLLRAYMHCVRQKESDTSYPSGNDWIQVRQSCVGRTEARVDCTQATLGRRQRVVGIEMAPFHPKGSIWGQSDINGKKLQYRSEGGQWTDITTISGMQDNQWKSFDCDVRTDALRVFMKASGYYIGLGGFRVFGLE